MQKFLSATEIEQLRAVHRVCKNKKHADRIKTILYLNMGDSFQEIAQRLILDDSTLRNYYMEYQSGGVKGLLRDAYQGGTSQLSCEQLQRLEQHLEAHTYLYAKEVGAYISTTFGIEYTVSGTKALLHRLNFVHKKPKHFPSKADRSEQEKFIEQYETLKKNKNPTDKIYFMDGTHPMHNSQLAYGWIKKGKEKFIKANTGRMRVNINGAYNIEEHKVIVRQDESINAQSTVALLEQILQEQPQGILYIISDNARYYRCQYTQDFLLKNQRIQFLYLPPYSPNLNLIERLWKFMKETITYNKYYEFFAVFRQKIIEFFDTIEIYKNELENLMTEKFQLFPI